MSLALEINDGRVRYNNQFSAFGLRGDRAEELGEIVALKVLLGKVFDVALGELSAVDVDNELVGVTRHGHAVAQVARLVIHLDVAHKELLLHDTLERRR